MNLELLLASADEHRPILEEGIPLTAASEAPAPSPERQPKILRADSRDPNDLALQRWGIIAPEGPDGERLLSLIEPLKRARQEMQQGKEIKIFRVPSVMDLERVGAWMRRDYWNESISVADLPRYLLILGDLDQVPLDLQLCLGGETFVGRLAFRTDQGYEAYVNKVLRAENAAATEHEARLLFYSARDGTPPTAVGHETLMVPCVAKCIAERDARTMTAKDIIEIPYSAGAPTAALLAEVARPGPAALFSLSHGLGPPSAGWTTEDQRALQGAMCIGSNQYLAAEAIAKIPFLPGGAWFYFACFGGATPADSAYYPWLKSLQDAGLWPRKLSSLLRHLPKPGDRPFIAALPQAALANPEGPLAVMAHADLAWSYSFLEDIDGSTRRPTRFLSIFRSLLEGARFGCAHHELLRFFVDTSLELTALYDRQAREAAAKARSTDGDDAEEPKAAAARNARTARLANLWMLRQDLMSYLLLGDPAARLSLASQPTSKRPPAPLTLSDEPADKRGRMEAAVLAVLGRGEAIGEVADRYMIAREDLARWIAAYQGAGREALSKLL